VKHEVTLTFLLDEEVTPGHLMRRILEAAGKYGALRPGEGATDGREVMLIRERTEEETAELRRLLGGATE
jgi:hypothetical protein